MFWIASEFRFSIYKACSPFSYFGVILCVPTSRGIFINLLNMFLFGLAYKTSCIADVNEYQTNASSKHITLYNRNTKELGVNVCMLMRLESFIVF